jgi:hypothetical protein
MTDPHDLISTLRQSRPAISGRAFEASCQKKRKAMSWAGIADAALAQSWRGLARSGIGKDLDSDSASAWIACGEGSNSMMALS